MKKPAVLLKELEALKSSYGSEIAPRKLELLAALERGRLSRAGEVLRLHECLCFLRAYPDSPRVLARVEHMLDRFESRGDLRRHRRDLTDSGIVGTETYFRFYWPTAVWLAHRWPDRISIDWDWYDGEDKLAEVLPLLVPYSELAALELLELDPRDWIDRLKGPGETDALFLIRRVESLTADSFGREKLYDVLDVPLRLAPGPGTPSRTLERHPFRPVAFQTTRLSTARPDLRRELRRRPRAVRLLSAHAGRRLVDLSREAMCTRGRDLDVFAWADERDVRLVDWEDGLQFAVLGQVPERRLFLEAVYGFLTLKNGVPLGYVLASALFRSAEFAFNVFETFRGTEAGLLFARALATARHLFGAEAFSLDPYQLGYGNPEGLESGAWWFYYKMGFRPRSRTVQRVLDAELRRMKRNPRHRSSAGTLETLASDNLYLSLRASKRDILGSLSPGHLGLRVSEMLAERFGADREGGVRTCSREAAELVGLRSLQSFSAAEQLAWERWSPLLTMLPGLSRWSPADKRALVEVVRAKGGRRETDFVARFDAHSPLRRAVFRLALED